MRRLLPSLAALAVALHASAGWAGQKLPVVADEALTSAERLLKNKTGDDRTVACVDALPFLLIVYQNVPDYAYSTGLYAECLFLTDDYEHAEKLLEKYLSLVPEEARKGPVAEKVLRAEERLQTCRTKLGHPLTDALPAPAPAPQPEPVTPSPAPTPAPSVPVTKPPPPVAAGKEFVLPPEEPGKPRAARRPLERELVVRAGYSPLVGVVGVGLEGRLGPVGLCLGSGAYPLAAGISVHPLGAAGPYASVHALWDGSSLFVQRESSRLGVGASVGWEFRLLSRLSLQAGVGGAYDRFLGPVITADLTAGAAFGL